MNRSLVYVSLLSLSACAAGHGLTGAPVQVEATLPNVPAEFKAKTVAEAPAISNWMSQFEDERMIAVVDEALAANPDILASEATARAARENARAIFGRSLPSVNYSFDNSYATQFSSQALGGGVVVDGRFNQPSFRQAFQFSWELDLWGRVRASNQAAQADFIASEADLAGAQLSIAGQAATAWINLNSAMEQERIARLTFDARKSTVDLTERRFGRGLSTALDVRTARTQMAAAEAQIAAQVRTRNDAARQLEVLLGRYPANEIEAPSELPMLGDISTPGDPMSILTRRPDIAASEARLEAAGLRAEAARLAIFPALRATSNVSNSSSIEFADIVDPGRISANILASLTQTVWAGGSVKADRKAALANAEAAAARYTNVVLIAWREVEDALDADRLLAVQEDAQRRALEEAQFAEELATRQYQNGLVSIFNLIQAQTTRLNSEANVVQIGAARAINRVNYHMALGGGASNAAALAQTNTESSAS